MIESAQVLDGSVGTIAPAVACFEQPGARRRTERVRDKPFGRQLRAVEITTGEPLPPDIELPGYADRHRLQRQVKDVRVRVGYRPPDRDRLFRRRRLNFTISYVGRYFRGPVEIEQRSVRQLSVKLPRQLRGQLLPARDPQA